MKKGYVYTVIFMLIISAVCSLLLAGTNSALSDRINTNAQIARQRALLEAFNLDTSGDADAIRTRFEANIKPQTLVGLDGYVQVSENGEERGYALPFEGSGLWGTIRGYLAVDPQLKQILGIVFTEQNETPGLGGRIDETDFKVAFRNYAVTPGQTIAYGTGEQDIHAVTGATQTSNAVLGIVNRLLKNELVQLAEVN